VSVLHTVGQRSHRIGNLHIEDRRRFNRPYGPP
jgi:hypothetical protein